MYEIFLSLHLCDLSRSQKTFWHWTGSSLSPRFNCDPWC